MSEDIHTKVQQRRALTMQFVKETWPYLTPAQNISVCEWLLVGVYEEDE